MRGFGLLTGFEGFGLLTGFKGFGLLKGSFSKTINNPRYSSVKYPYYNVRWDDFLVKLIFLSYRYRKSCNGFFNHLAKEVSLQLQRIVNIRKQTISILYSRPCIIILCGYLIPWNKDDLREKIMLKFTWLRFNLKDGSFSPWSDESGSGWVE